MSLNVTVVNSSIEFLQSLLPLLEKEGYAVSQARDVSAALRLLDTAPPDLVIIEVNYLETNGQPFFAKLRELGKLPILFLTGMAQGEPGIQVRSLAARSDLERIETALAGVQQDLAERESKTCQIGELIIDSAKKRVTFRGQRVPLPRIQFRLLSYLAAKAGEVVGYQELLKEVWGYEGNEGEARELLKVHIRQIRRKLGLSANNPEYLESVRGFGYMLVAPEDN